MNKCIILKEKMKNMEQTINNWLRDNPGVKIIAISQLPVPGVTITISSTIIYDE